MILGPIWLDLRLHTPMYFILSHLAIINICCASSNLPSMLENPVMHKNTLLCLMHYADNFVCDFCWSRVPDFGCNGLRLACGDLPSTLIHCHCELENVHGPVCHSLGMWAFPGHSVSNSLSKVDPLWALGGDHFCEILSVLKLACGDTWISEVFVFTGGVFILVEPLSLMLASYIHIIWTILKIQTKERHRKVFSTYSHFCVVGFYFGIAIMAYLVPDNSQCEEEQNILTLFYTLLNPLLNPLIYSLKNVQRALYRRLEFYFREPLSLRDLIGGARKLPPKRCDLMMRIIRVTLPGSRIEIPGPLFSMEIIIYRSNCHCEKLVKRLQHQASTKPRRDTVE